MSSSMYAHSRPAADPKKLWASGVATALVAALVALVGILLVRGILDIHVLAPEEAGVWGSASTAGYAAAAALAALVATAILQALLMTTPKPRLFFGWIMGLATVAGALAPLMAGATLEEQVATGIINAAIGAAIWSLLSATATRAIRSGPPAARA
jgi:hypothetical protein